MTDAIFADTNVFVYLRDTTDPLKHARAQEWIAFLWQTRRGRVSTQVLHELYASLTGKLRPGMPREQARTIVRSLAAWGPLAVDRTALERAWVVQDRYRLAFWDALIVAAAQLTRSRYLLTEDLNAGQDLDGVTVVNPFRVEPSALA